MSFHGHNQALVWNSLKINNEVFMISAIQKDDTIEVLLTNFIEIWMEKFTDKIILERCRELNPLLNVEAFNYKEIVLNILNNISKHIVEASPEQIKLRAEVEGGFIKFVLNFIKGTPQNFWKFVTKPLCISSMEIIRQHRFLLDLVKQKDEEIAEYKSEGAELIRKNIETKPFTEEQLRTDIINADSNDYTSIFQTMSNFYNALCIKSTSSGSSNEKTKQNIITPNQDDATTLGVTNKSISTSMKTEALPLQNKKQKKNAANKELITNKARTANMIYRPIKKLKKSLTDSIL